jgi:hypothetical protein
MASTKNLGDRVEIRIRDNGTGITPDVKEKMFNPFFTTKPTGEGTGLGLSISHDIIVKQHAGAIEVDTELGEFTEIRNNRVNGGPDLGVSLGTDEIGAVLSGDESGPDFISTSAPPILNLRPLSPW